MRSPGIEVRPLVTLNGAAISRGVLRRRARARRALLGRERRMGVATTTLSHERAGRPGCMRGCGLPLADLVAELAAHSVDGRPALDNAATRAASASSRCGQLPSNCSAMRAISATRMA